MKVVFSTFFARTKTDCGSCKVAQLRTTPQKPASFSETRKLLPVLTSRCLSGYQN